MTPPDEPPSNPYDPNWPQPETPPPSSGSEPPSAPYAQPSESPYTQPYGQQPPAGEQASPYPPYGQEQQAWGQAPGQAPQGQPGWGQQPYGQQPYGQVPYGTPTYAAPLTPHPSATTAMVLGIGALGGMFVCGIPIVLAPFAWMVGGRAVKEIDANPGRYSGRDQAQAGRVMGMIGSGLLVLGIIAIIAFVTLAVVASDSSDLSYDPDTGSYTSDPSF